MAIKGSIRDPCGCGNVLSFSVLVVILYLVLQDVTVGKNWVKGT